MKKSPNIQRAEREWPNCIPPVLSKLYMRFNSSPSGSTAIPQKYQHRKRALLTSVGWQRRVGSIERLEMGKVFVLRVACMRRRTIWRLNM